VNLAGGAIKELLWKAIGPEWTENPFEGSYQSAMVAQSLLTCWGLRRAVAAQRSLIQGSGEADFAGAARGRQVDHRL
jgi:hypothetical protein